MAHSPKARRVRRDLDKERAAASARIDKNLVWTAGDKEILELITATIDRKTELTNDYTAAEDAKTAVKISAEPRLLESSQARLLRQVQTELPPAPSLRTVKARRAAHARWDRARS